MSCVSPTPARATESSIADAPGAGRVRVMIVGACSLEEARAAGVAPPGVRVRHMVYADEIAATSAIADLKADPNDYMVLRWVEGEIWRDA